MRESPSEARQTKRKRRQSGRLRPSRALWIVVGAVACLVVVAVVWSRTHHPRAFAVGDGPWGEYYPQSIGADRPALASKAARRISVRDLPIASAPLVRALLREHVAAPSQRLASQPAPAEGPIECTVGGHTVYVEPTAGQVVSRRRRPEWVDPYPRSPWDIEREAGATWIVGPLGRVGRTPEQLGETRDIDISPDGRLLLAVCVTRDGPIAPDSSGQEPYGGVALWDRQREKGWWVVHPEKSTGDMLGRIASARFFDDRYTVLHTPNGASNALVLLCDMNRMPATPGENDGWMGSVFGYFPLQGTICVFVHTAALPWAHDGIEVLRRGKGQPGGPPGWSCASFSVDGAEPAFSVAPDGRSYCGIERAGGVDEAKSNLLVIVQGGSRQVFDVGAGDLGPEVGEVVGSAWAPDSRSIALDLALGILEERDIGEPKPIDSRRHRLAVLEVGSGQGRTLLEAEAALEPRWLGVEGRSTVAGG
jgi:hypothetical protein